MESVDTNKPDHSLDPDAWVKNYAKYLYHYALGRVSNDTEAQNLVQETFLAALRSRKNFAGESTERTWLTGILKHKILDYYRTKYRETPVSNLQNDTEQEINSFFDSTDHFQNEPKEWSLDPQALSENKEFWQTFEHCRELLPNAAREAFTMRTLDNVKGKEICAILNISQSNLWVLLHRARLQLRECLEKNWFQNA